jgi:hypothetical protein
MVLSKVWNPFDFGTPIQGKICLMYYEKLGWKNMIPDQFWHMDPAFWCGHVGVTQECFFNFPSVYDLNWSHYYSKVIHIQKILFFDANFLTASCLLQL